MRHFDAHSDINKLQTLKLTDCVQYYGHLSGSLRGSVVVKENDLTLDGAHDKKLS